MSERDPLQVSSTRYDRDVRARRRAKIIFSVLFCFLGLLALVLILVFVLEHGASSSGNAEAESSAETANPLLQLAFPLRGNSRKPSERKSSNLGLKNDLVHGSISRGKEALQRRKDMEDKLFKSNRTIQKGVSSYYHQSLINITKEVKNLTECAYLAEASVRYIVERNITVEQLAQFNTTPLISAWPHCQVRRYLRCDPADTIPSLDGSCNNMVDPLLGSSTQPFRRLLPPYYQDGLSTPRESAAPRAVSLLLQKPTSAISPAAQQLSMLFLSWGQFLDHDITATASTKGLNGSGILCCGMPEDEKHPECLPIDIPHDDSYMNMYGVKCMEFVRSAGAPQCLVGGREQMNLASSYIDASMMYGLTRAEAGRLRAHRSGYLRAHLHPDGRWILPISNKPDDGCNRPEQTENSRYCFKSGDSRVNENTGLTAMHTVWMREHNRIASELSDLNPRWDDDRVYLEARKIVIAEIQHITYNEFLPLLFGKALYEHLDLKPTSSGYSSSYDATIDPAVSNEFATAAYRFGHSMLQVPFSILIPNLDITIQGLVALEGKQGLNIEYVQLHKTLFNPFPLWDMSRLDDLVRGGALQNPRLPHTTFSSQVTDHLFQPPNASHGLDLFALNLQRGRDHGLAPYTHYRALCQLSSVSTWSQLEGVFKSQSLSLLPDIYRDVDDVDLYVGILAEIPVGDSLLGPVGSCILADQFVRLKKGDRFWYETPGHFTTEQLSEIKTTTTLGRVLCQNGDALDAVQPRAMESVSRTNSKTRCSSTIFQSMDLSLWGEPFTNTAA